MTSPNSNFTELAAITLDRYSGQLADNVSDNIPFLYFLKTGKGNGIKEVVDGGTKILENLRYADNSTFSWFNGYEELAVTPTEDFTAAEFNWKECNANIIFSQRDVAINSGKQKKFDLIDGKRLSTIDTLSNNIGAALFYSNTENDGKAIGGLQHLVADLPTSGTVGGIDRSAQTWWANQYYDFSTNGIVASSATIKPAMDSIYRSTQRNGDLVDLILAGDTYFGYYETYLDAKRMFTDNKADGGFDTLRYKNAKVIYDPNCSSTRMYMLNSKHIKYRPHADINMVVGKPKSPVNQMATVIPVSWMGNLTISNAAVHGVICA